jgi:hypothetical protein
MQKSIDATVRRRAREACEYCRMPQALYRYRFQVDHVIAEAPREDGVGESRIGLPSLQSSQRAQHRRRG